MVYFLKLQFSSDFKNSYPNNADNFVNEWSSKYINKILAYAESVMDVHVETVIDKITRDCDENSKFYFLNKNES